MRKLKNANYDILNFQKWPIIKEEDLPLYNRMLKNIEKAKGVSRNERGRWHRYMHYSFFENFGNIRN